MNHNNIKKKDNNHLDFNENYQELVMQKKKKFLYFFSFPKSRPDCMGISISYLISIASLIQ